MEKYRSPSDNTNTQANTDWDLFLNTETSEAEQKTIRQNTEIQELFDSSIKGGLLAERETLQQYNMARNLEDCYLASGQNGYFSEQIDIEGFSGMKLQEQDKNDAKFIAKSFGRNITFGDNNLQVLYTTLLGTTESNYAMQAFPAGIMEDVFQCDPTHSLPIRPRAGETEADYYSRLMEYSIAKKQDFPQELKPEVVARTRRLSESFLKNKNRIYLIPIGSIKNNRASFGDVKGLRDGNMIGDNLSHELSRLPTLQGLCEDSHIENASDAYSNPNFDSEFGIAIYGEISEQQISYIEVPRRYEKLQQIALELGSTNGDEISEEIENQLEYGYSF